ncbi:hypothetical protein LINPERPRIM_LOCUS10116 [Linum perenne]
MSRLRRPWTLLSPNHGRRLFQPSIHPRLLPPS